MGLLHIEGQILFGRRKGEQDMASAFKELRFLGDKHRAIIEDYQVLKEVGTKCSWNLEESCFCLRYTEEVA